VITKKKKAKDDIRNTFKVIRTGFDFFFKRGGDKSEGVGY
jgi:hypothetical protein